MSEWKAPDDLYFYDDWLRQHTKGRVLCGNNKYIRADHVNELVAAAYEAAASKLDGLHRYAKDHHSKDYRQGHEAALAGGAGVLRNLTPADATAALANRDARVREAALKEAWEKLVCPDPTGKAHSLISYRNGYTQARNDLVALIEKDKA